MRKLNKAICNQCSKVFYHRRKTQKFCSAKCMGKSFTTSVERKCRICGKIFLSQPYRLKSNRGKYCSKECCDKSMIGTTRHLGFKHSKYSKNKIKAALKKAFPNGRKGKNNPAWKGGKFNFNDYIMVLKPKHPFPNHTAKYVFEHRLVVEQWIGRYLTSEERCHHVNEIKSDNRPENLMAFINESAHQRFHKNPNSVTPSEIIFDGRKLTRARLQS